MTSTTTAVQSFQVRGMTCDHCVHAVRAEVGAIAGVRHVSVELGAGRVGVSSEQPIAIEAIRAAVDEAGYTLG
jgi:copper ion binding protein